MLRFDDLHTMSVNTKLTTPSCFFLVHRRVPLPDLPPPMQISASATAAPIPPPMQMTSTTTIRPPASQVAFGGLAASGLSAGGISPSKVCSVTLSCGVICVEIHSEFGDRKMNCGFCRSKI